jgi:putative MATE family efflux protein
VGAGDLAGAGARARQALLWSLLISLPLAALGVPLTPAIIGLFGLPVDVAAVARDYLGVTMGSVGALTLMLLAGGVLRGAGDGRTPMLVTLGANVVNVAVSYALIYGEFGLPELGAVGSAWGSVAARLLGAAVLVAVLLRGRAGVRAGGGGSWAPRPGAARAILRVGLPAALEEVLVIGAFASLTPVVATLGTAPLAAHRVVINVLSLSFLPGIGFGLAATALVAQAVGAGRPAEARAVTAIALRWAAIWMGGLGLLFLVAAPALVRIFSDDPALIAAGAAAIRVVALTQPLWAVTFVLAGALRGTGDTRTPLAITGAVNWAAVALAALLVQVFAPSLALVWAAFLIGAPIEAYLFYRAWRRYRG